MLSAIYLLAQNIAAAANSMTVVAKNEVLKHVKRVGRRMLQPGVIGISVLPGIPSVFRTRYPDKYEESFGSTNPVAHPFGLALVMYAQSIKMRVCDSSMSSQVLPMNSPCTRWATQNMMLQFANMMMRQNHRPGDRNDNDASASVRGAPKASPRALEDQAMQGAPRKVLRKFLLRMQLMGARSQLLPRMQLLGVRRSSLV